MRSVDPAERTWRAHLEYFRRLTIRGGGRASDEGGILLWNSDYPLATFTTGAARIDRGVAVDAVFHEAETFFQGRASYEILALDGPDDDILRSMQDRGLAVGDPHALQFLDRRPAAPQSSPSGIDVRRVEDDEGIADVVAVNRDVSGLPDDLFPHVFSRPETVLSPDITAVVAYADEEPVATAQVMVDDAVAYVGWVAVVRHRMREGLGTMVTSEVLEAGFAAGATCAALSASRMGEPVYRRMGFVDVGTFRTSVVR